MNANERQTAPLSSVWQGAPLRAGISRRQRRSSSLLPSRASAARTCSVTRSQFRISSAGSRNTCVFTRW